MPPPWSSRLLQTGNNNSSSSSLANTLASAPDQQDYLPPHTAFDHTPTLHPQASPRPATSGGKRRPSHNRSGSNPLPKLFSRKKSLHDLHDSDVPLDDDLVPVLDEAPGTDRTPSRVISGKRTRQEDEGDKITRKCMCCDSKCSVPKGLDKFRCMACVTINDLKPVSQQKDRQRADMQEDGHEAMRSVLLTVERTKAIIDRCIVLYLESRARRASERITRTEAGGMMPPQKDPRTRDLVIRTGHGGPEQRNRVGLLSTSPPAHPAKGHTESPRSDSTAARLQDPGQIRRKPIPVSIPAQPRRDPPPPPLDHVARTPSGGGREGQWRPPPSPRRPSAEEHQRRRYDVAKAIFRPLEEYMLSTFGDYTCLNSAFHSQQRPLPPQRADSRSSPQKLTAEHAASVDVKEDGYHGLSELDGKTLLLGELGENSTWWTGKLDKLRPDRGKRKKVADSSSRFVTSKTPYVEWAQLREWYETVHSAGTNWQACKIHLSADSVASMESRGNVEEIEEDLFEAREHAIRALLKITETVLKRPSRPLREPEDVRFLVIILANPSLYPTGRGQKQEGRARTDSRGQTVAYQQPSPKKTAGVKSSTGIQHTGLLKRILGLIAQSPDTCHRYLIGWFARFNEEMFIQLVDVTSSFINHRIARASNPRRRSNGGLDDGGLIPDLSGSAMNTSAQLHSAMGLSGSVKKRTAEGDGDTEWANDWQIRAAAKVMALLFTANNIWQGKTDGNANNMTANDSHAAKTRRSGQLLHTSSFYNTLLDYHDMIADFRTWESKREKFAFCQYPLFLSMGSKIKILEYDARRQMENKAREAYFDQVIRQRANDGYFHLRVRRECLVDDSLRQISEAVGSGQEDLKKGLRVHFAGEEGVDAGGLRKEWFLMLVRDIFDPNHGMFVYDEESQACYFNPNSWETSDQYHLVGALLGLAIYNSTILDVAFPSFAFRKLLAAAPSSITNASNISSITGTKGQMTYTVADLAEFRPRLAAGLQQLLDFEGDVEETYCWTFVVPVERYGTVVEVPLVSNGEGRAVTNANRQEFVDAYIRYLLDTSVAKQFEPFKRGFFTVCAGNALSLFRAEEIELLVRGSDESLDVDSLQAVAVYENWRHAHPPHLVIPKPAETVPVIGWFWEIFAQATPDKQRKLLTFITGTDRIPAVGATSLVLRIVAGRDGWGGGGSEERGRFPVARTCFNMLVLWHYDYREQLEQKLWTAVEESEGFGLK